MNLIPGHTVVQGHYNRGGRGGRGQWGAQGTRSRKYNPLCLILQTIKNKKSPRGIRPCRCCPSPRGAKYIMVTQDTSPKDKTSICLAERKLEVWGK